MRTTRHKMTDYHQSDNLFLDGRDRMPRTLDFPWMHLRSVFEDDLPPPLGTVLESLMPRLVDSIQNHSTLKRKAKYQCANCQSRVWAKPQLNIRCGVCDRQFDEAADDRERII